MKYKNLQVKDLPMGYKGSDNKYEETVSKPIDPSMMFNIDTSQQNQVASNNSDEENDTVEMSITKSNEKPKDYKIEESDSTFLNKIIIEFNVRAMQIFNQGDIEKADKLLSKLMKIVNTY